MRKKKSCLKITSVPWRGGVGRGVVWLFQLPQLPPKDKRLAHIVLLPPLKFTWSQIQELFPTLTFQSPCFQGLTSASSPSLTAARSSSLAVQQGRQLFRRALFLWKAATHNRAVNSHILTGPIPIFTKLAWCKEVTGLDNTEVATEVKTSALLRVLHMLMLHGLCLEGSKRAISKAAVSTTFVKCPYLLPFCTSRGTRLLSMLQLCPGQGHQVPSRHGEQVTSQMQSERSSLRH